jgi:hypothetical protein
MPKEDTAALLAELRISVEALRAGLEALAKRQDVGTWDKALGTLKGLADEVLNTVDRLEELEAETVDNPQSSGGLRN